MGRASTERDSLVHDLCHAADAGVFTAVEVRRMFAHALQYMTALEMQNMVADCTRFEDADDVVYHSELE
jgi:hypothetical protein